MSRARSPASSLYSLGDQLLWLVYTNEICTKSCRLTHQCCLVETVSGYSFGLDVIQRTHISINLPASSHRIHGDNLIQMHQLYVPGTDSTSLYARVTLGIMVFFFVSGFSRNYNLGSSLFVCSLLLSAKGLITSTMQTSALDPPIKHKPSTSSSQVTLSLPGPSKVMALHNKLQRCTITGVFFSATDDPSKFSGRGDVRIMCVYSLICCKSWSFLSSYSLFIFSEVFLFLTLY